jgi:lipopolysaccharide cholinephosphotransferase
MATYEIRPLQMRMLQILEVIDEAFRREGLRYAIFGGTLLGAVRHKGFIPWDDDMDIVMPRPDYERFIACSKEILPEGYEFVCAENDPNYPLAFGKVQDANSTLVERRHLSYLGGIYVDVFPMDAVPSGWLARHWQYTQYEYWKRCLYLVHRNPYRHGHGPSSWVPLLVRKLYTMEKIQRKIRQLLMKYDFDKCKFVADYSDGLRMVLPKDLYSTFAPIEFEGKQFMGIARTDEYLTAMYGSDYMTPPPVGQQRQHNFHYMDLEKPYREYSDD